MNVTVVSDAPIVATVVEDTIGLVLSSGTDGTDGKTILNGSGAPSPSLGTDGDFYIDTVNDALYGPKTAGVWGSATSLVGPAGAAGEPGPAGADSTVPGPVGPAGADGADGADGKTVLNGAGAPSGSLGTNGDFYIDTAASTIYGPKAGGAWGSPVSLVGPAGADGAAGANGTNGTNGIDGKTVLNGAGAPSAGLGTNGDFYINTAASTIYGPKAGGAWGSPTSLVGPAGPAGADGSSTTPVSVKTANYSANVGEFIPCDISGGVFTVTLPTAPANKSTIVVQVVKEGAANSVTVLAGGTDVLTRAGGSNTMYMNLFLETITLQYQASTGIWLTTTTACPANFTIGFPGVDAATPISDANISIDYATRVLTITPPLGYFNLFVDGNGLITKFRKTGTINFPAFTDTSGVWYFHFDTSGNAVTTQTPWGSFDVICPVYRILWNATLTPDSAKSQVENIEVHLNTISAVDHLWKHTYGTVWVSGFVITDNRITSGSPNADGRNAVVSLSTGSNLDDNLSYSVTNTTSGGNWNQDLGNLTAGSLNATNAALMKVRTQTAGGLTVMLDATRFPFPWDSGTNRPQYITALGVRTPVTNNYFFVMFVYATPDPRNGNAIRLSAGTAEYANITAAQATIWGDQQAVYPTLNDKEIRPLYKLIFEYKSAYDVGSKYTRLYQVDDLRKTVVTTSATLAGSLPATSVTSVPFGTLSSTNVQDALNELAAEKRESLTAPRTYYVATTGSDTLNDGLTVGTPFLTIQKAVDIVSATLDHGAQALTIQVADGTYTAGAVLNQHIGSGLITILGNTTTPSNCVISVTSGRCFQCAWSSWSVSGFRLTTSGGAGSAIYTTGNTARLRVISIDFGPAVVSHIEVQHSALLDLVSCNISGGAQFHQYVGAGGRISTSVQTVTITGTPAFSVTFHRCSSGSIANVANITYSGSATGIRYVVDLNALTICGGSVTFFPGNVSGTTATGGQYS